MATIRQFKVVDSTSNINLGKVFSLEDVETLKVVEIHKLSNKLLNVYYYNNKLKLQNNHMTYICVEI